MDRELKRAKYVLTHATQVNRREREREREREKRAR